MENKFKQSINLVIKEILSIPTHSVEYIKEELQIIYLNKYYLDKNGFKFLNDDLSYDINEIEETPWWRKTKREVYEIWKRKYI